MGVLNAWEYYSSSSELSGQIDLAYKLGVTNFWLPDGVTSLGWIDSSAGYSGGTLFANLNIWFAGDAIFAGTNNFWSSDQRDDVGIFLIREHQISSVPLPATVWLFGSGLIGLIGVARKI